MAIDDRTAGLNLQLPNPANFLNEDVLRLRSAFTVLDAAVVARAPLASPTFTGTPAGPTAAPDTSTTQLATTAFFIGQAGTVLPLAAGAAAVGSSLRYSRADHRHPTDATRAPLASPAFTGTPTAPTAGFDVNTTQIATTAYVKGQNYIPSSRTIFTSAGLLGGGDMSANRTIGPDFATALDATDSGNTTKVMNPARTHEVAAAAAAGRAFVFSLLFG